jgi:hypothetical protein
MLQIWQEMTLLVGKLMSANEENVKKNAQLQADNVKLQQLLMEREQNLDEVNMVSEWELAKKQKTKINICRCRIVLLL